MRTIRALMAASALAALLAAPAVAATPPTQTGCPAGSDVLAVADLGDYPIAPSVDQNNDGLICGRALPTAVSMAFGAPVDPVYLFADNDLPARR